MELIWGRFPGLYVAPLVPEDTISNHVVHAAQDGVEAQVLWGNNSRAHLGDAGAETRAREPLVLTPFGKASIGAFAVVSGLGWGLPES